MPTYKTPGVYVEEISVFPPSVAAVETAIPAFIGYTEKATGEDGDATNVPTRITSLLEYETIFGKAPVETVAFNVTQTWDSSGGAFTDTAITVATAPAAKPCYLAYSMKMFFANGGGPCYIVSVGAHATPPSAAALQAGVAALEPYDEPTLLVFPDACRLATAADHGAVAGTALSHCSALGDRFTIIDVQNALPGETDTNAEVTTNLRGNVPGDIDLAKYGAAYFPYVKSTLPYRTDDAQVTVASHTINSVGDNTFAAPTAIAANTAISDTSVKDAANAVYNGIKARVAAMRVTLPPSGAVAGVYARVDSSRGVWKAPANVSLLNVIGPAIDITNDLNDGLNVDVPSGKSVNAIRAFTGKGTLVWGARTLAGNDNENRYVPVRRFLIFAEESIKKAAERFVFEPNDANTWTKVRSMIENFLIIQWRDGALAGAKPEHAFYVSVGLNQTMTAQDILEGHMIVEIGLAIVRPAEFIVLRFAQKMQES